MSTSFPEASVGNRASGQLESSPMDDLRDAERQARISLWRGRDARTPGDAVSDQEQLKFALWVESEIARLDADRAERDLQRRVAERQERQASIRGWIRIGAEGLAVLALAIALGLALANGSDISELFDRIARALLHGFGPFSSPIRP
jgi:hypothetical protein